MAWLAVDRDGSEWIYLNKPARFCDKYLLAYEDDCSQIHIPKGSIKKLIGRDLTWEDEPVELKEE